MSHTYPVEAHHVKKSSHIMLKGWPCKIAEVKTSKTGKHGHAKCNITGIDVITQRKYNEVHPGHIVLAGFEPIKNEYEVTDFSEAESYFEVMDASGENTRIEADLEREADAKLMRDLLANAEAGGEKYYQCMTVTAPVGEGDKCQLVTAIVDSKESAE